MSGKGRLDRRLEIPRHSFYLADLLVHNHHAPLIQAAEKCLVHPARVSN